jgi:uncharacterized CHY-type Zn-finger protein
MDLMSHRKRLVAKIITASFFIAAAIPGTSFPADKGDDYPAYPPQVLSSDYYPCSECHADMDANPTQRELEEHSEIQIIGHAEEERWCLDCHDADDRNKLRLINNKKVEFAASYRLCGQCHGSIYQDWKAGIHGKRTGYWDGPKQYYLCTSCHNPHSPRFKSMVPEPVPIKPEQTLRK